VRGEWLDLSEVDGEPSGLEAEGILVDTGACTIEVRLGDRAVILDFS
jgi:hypothetical protein